jgi:hypothetical protein
MCKTHRAIIISAIKRILGATLAQQEADAIETSGEKGRAGRCEKSGTMMKRAKRKEKGGEMGCAEKR